MPTVYPNQKMFSPPVSPKRIVHPEPESPKRQGTQTHRSHPKNNASMQNQRRTKVWASRTGVAPKVNASGAGAAQKLGPQNWSCPKITVVRSEARAAQRFVHPEQKPPKSQGIQNRSSPKVGASRTGAFQKLVHPEPEPPKSWGIHNHYCSKRKGRWLRKTGFFSSSCINMVYIPPDSCSYKKNAIIEEKPVLFLQF